MRQLSFHMFAPTRHARHGRHAVCPPRGSINVLNSSPASTARSVGPLVGLVAPVVPAAGDAALPRSMKRAIASIDVNRPPPIKTVSNGLFFLCAHLHAVAGLMRFPAQRLGT